MYLHPDYVQKEQEYNRHSMHNSNVLLLLFQAKSQIRFNQRNGISVDIAINHDPEEEAGLHRR